MIGYPVYCACPRYINAAFGCESILQPHGNERGSGRHHHASGSLIWVGCCHQKGPPPFKQQSGGPRMGKRNGKGHEPLRVPSKLVSNGKCVCFIFALVKGAVIRMHWYPKSKCCCLSLVSFEAIYMALCKQFDSIIP